MIKGIIFDFNKTIFDPEIGGPSEGAITLLEKVKGKFKLCLISSVEVSKISEEVRKNQIIKLGIYDFFDLVAIVPKKTIEDFKECVEKMQLNPEEVLVVGDRVEKEISHGNKLGMKTLWYKSGKYSTVEPENDMQKPDLIITHLSEVADFLKL